MIMKIKNKPNKKGPFYASGILGKLSTHSNRTLIFFSSELKRLRFVLTDEIQSFRHSTNFQFQNNSFILTVVLTLALSDCLYLYGVPESRLIIKSLNVRSSYAKLLDKEPLVDF